TKNATAADTDGSKSGNTSYYPQRTLKDTRNNTSYVVRKLADGNCWMSSNLKLTLSQGATYETGTFSGGTYNWTIQASEVDTSSTDPYNIAISQNTKANVNSGNWYYPWYAATAGQGTQTASPTINRSICPKGWRLPNGNNISTKSFYNLITTAYGLPSSEAGVNSLKAAPLSFTAVGFYRGGSLGGSNHGCYWSATPNTGDASRAYVLDFTTSIHQYDYEKIFGFSVRCVSI
ncbi:hypothetical protein IKE84_01370, partial [Candidatus Saccharibacteria bacterium]|nr:hypothetical protein [Candidatus Saccharibacteria bacterium]